MSRSHVQAVSLAGGADAPGGQQDVDAAAGAQIENPFALVQVGDEQVRDYVKQQVAAYKYPRIVTFADALPKGPTGKILKREIVVMQQRPGRPDADVTVVH